MKACLWYQFLIRGLWCARDDAIAHDLSALEGGDDLQLETLAHREKQLQRVVEILHLRLPDADKHQNDRAQPRRPAANALVSFRPPRAVIKCNKV